MSERDYLIKNTKTRLYWNNTFGWGDLAGAEFFSEEETKRLNLPLDGTWHRVKEKISI